MNKHILSLISELKAKTELHIANIQKEQRKSFLSTEAIEILMKMVELEQNYIYSYQPLDNERPTNPPLDEANTQDEINKVCRRLKLWAKRPEQINSRILRLFLKMKEADDSDITVSSLMKHYGNDVEFIKNFPQLRHISSKNHGKVFDIQHDIVTIWSPVSSCVEAFRKNVT